MATKTRLTLDERIEAFSLMASLVEMVGPSETADEATARIYDLAYDLAMELMRDAEIERDVRDVVARSVESDPTWRDDMTTLKRMARERVRQAYAEEAK